MSVDDLFALCPLNDVMNPELPAGCIAGLYKKFCTDVDTYEKLSVCQDIYDQVFGASIFNSIGQVCPAWRNGPRSLKCKSTLKNFKVDLGYMTVTSEHASNLTSVILGSTKFAPCYDVGGITCRWAEEKEPVPSPTVPKTTPNDFGLSVPSSFSMTRASTSTTQTPNDNDSGGRVNIVVLVSALVGGIAALSLAVIFIGRYQYGWDLWPRNGFKNRESNGDLSKQETDEERVQEEKQQGLDVNKEGQPSKETESANLGEKVGENVHQTTAQSSRVAFYNAMRMQESMKKKLPDKVAPSRDEPFAKSNEADIRDTTLDDIETWTTYVKSLLSHSNPTIGTLAGNQEGAQKEKDDKIEGKGVTLT